MNQLTSYIRKNWWPISAILFCPCHLPLSMGAIVGLTAGTSVGALLTTHYASIESTLAVAFSFYFVMAFMIWAVRGPRTQTGEAVCVIDANGNLRRAGFSTKQIIIWGIGSALLMPILVLAGFLIKDDLLGKIMTGAEGFDMANSGFIWLISISTIVMIPVMVVWIAWMWAMWSRTDVTAEPQEWEYEYE
ncbi:MAG: hypothetical protein V9G20_31290 [Candidatus Promineifilaceae bacterium]